MTDVWGLILGFVHWVGATSDRILDGLGLEGGLLDRIITWMTGDADVYMASVLALFALVLWTIPWSLLASLIDRRARARMEGRIGPSHRGAWGYIQELADLVKLKLRWRDDLPSASAHALSLAMVLGALAVLPLGPWSRLADPAWSTMVAATLLALSTVPTALVSSHGQRHPALAESAGSGVVLILAVASVVLITGSGRGDELVGFQKEVGWGVLLAPLGFTLFLLAMYWDSARLERARGTGRTREEWPCPRRAMERFVGATRYYSLGVLGAIVFLGGWLGPGPDGHWWTLLKAMLLLALVSSVAGALPLIRPGDTAHDIRRRWFPVAAINLVLVAGILEVMA